MIYTQLFAILFIEILFNKKLNFISNYDIKYRMGNLSAVAEELEEE